MDNQNAAVRTEHLEGEWTVMRAGELVALARAWAEEASRVDLDCSKLGRVDVAALQVLLALKRALVAKGGALRVLSPSDVFASALDATGLTQEILG